MWNMPVDKGSRTACRSTKEEFYMLKKKKKKGTKTKQTKTKDKVA